MSLSIDTRRLAVSCKALILIEAPSSAYHSGMLGLGKTHKERRRPDAILHQTPQILLWHRLARVHHVSLHRETRGGYAVPPEDEGCPRTVPQSHCALPGRSCCLCRVPLHLVWARRPLHPRGHSLCAGTRPVHEGDPWGQGQ